ncbi:hypothetical protein C8Q72DRAFT_556532 [Fomitopsis betulina]|nr:hypothetical protein C8Q72DRAFT_556532 [Fomitopsis betulina]
MESDPLPLELVQGDFWSVSDQRSPGASTAADVPPAPPHAGKKHIACDAEEFNDRQLRGQCQHCLKHSGEGVTMRRCSACKLERYRSQVCQKAAWLMHKKLCRLNQVGRAIRARPL